MKLHFTLFAAVGLTALSSSDHAKAQLLDLGTTYTIEGQGFTGTGSPNFTERVQLSSSTLTFDNRKLQITVTQTPWHTLAPLRSGVFAEFYIRAARRNQFSPPPLVDPSTDTVANNVFFEVAVSGVQLKVPAIYNFRSVYWNVTRNSVADAGITACGGPNTVLRPTQTPAASVREKTCSIFPIASCAMKRRPPKFTSS